MPGTFLLGLNGYGDVTVHESGFDLLLTPTMSEPPVPLGTYDDSGPDPMAAFRRAVPAGAFTAIFNATGQPAASLPLHWTEAGLPVGVQLSAPLGREDLLIRVAAQLDVVPPKLQLLDDGFPRAFVVGRGPRSSTLVVSTGLLTVLSPDELGAVLSHELAHVRRHDWCVQIAAEGVRALLWFNPLVWIACRRLRRESEQACDDAVLGNGVPARAYASHLLELARKCRLPEFPWSSAVPIITNSFARSRSGPPNSQNDPPIV